MQPGFAALLGSTSSLRKEQEEEGKLAERMHEQRLSLQAAEKRYADVNRRLAETRATAKEDQTGESVLEAARREAAEGRRLAKKLLPANLESRRETLVKLHRLLAEPAKVSPMHVEFTHAVMHGAGEVRMPMPVVFVK